MVRGMKSWRGTDFSRLRRLVYRIRTGQIFLLMFPELAYPSLRRHYIRLLRKLADRKKPFVLQIENGGLGDHIAYCGLPEAVFNKYGLKMQISEQSKFNNPEIKEFVWSKNPFTAFTPEPGIKIFVQNVKRFSNYNEMLFDLLDLNGPNVRLYYQPRLRSELSQKIVCDFSAGRSSRYYAYSQNDFRRAILNILQSEFSMDGLVLLCPVSKYPDLSLVRFIQSELNLPILYYHSLPELADILFSALNRVLLDSGAKSLAAAYHKSSTVLVRGYTNTAFHYPELNIVRI